MAGGKRFASDFQRIDAVKPSDKLLIQDSEDGVVKFAFPNQVTAVNGWKVVENIEDLPLNPPRKDIGYIVGNDIYFWVGTDGDTLDGKYQKANIFRGEDGATPFIHFAYANSADGYNDFSISESGNRKYLGIYVDDVAEGSTDPTDYKWSRIQGEQGTPSYVHIAFANSADGVEDFSLTESEGRTYLGIYVDSTKGALDDPAAYKWMHTQGIQGVQGERGEQGEPGVTYYEVATTWQDLVDMRNDGMLVAGLRYRITDYVTTTTQAETVSAELPFDIIVTAISADALSERANAVWSERDTDGYFSNKPLNAWQVWYCLDNNPDRFGWADMDFGRGVIYRLIDENGNDCPFDMYNIMYAQSSSPESADADAEAQAQAVSGEPFFNYGGANALMEDAFIIRNNKIERATGSDFIPFVIFKCKGNYGRIIGNTVKDCDFTMIIGSQLLGNSYAHITFANINGSAKNSTFANLSNPGIDISGEFYGKMFDIHDNNVDIEGSEKYTFVTTSADDEVLVYTAEDTLGGGGLTKVTATGTAVTLQPNTLTVWTEEISALTLSFAAAEDGAAPIYGVQFATGSTAAKLTVSGVQWVGDGSAPTFDAYATHTVWFINGIGYVKTAYRDVVTLRATYNNTTERLVQVVYYDVFDKILQMKVRGQDVTLSTALTLKPGDYVDITIEGSTYQMFRGITELTSVNLLKGKLNSIRYMFYQCSALLSVSLGDLSRVDDGANAFYQCTSLMVLNFYNLTKVQSLSRAFQGCTALKDVDATRWNLSGLNNLGSVDLSYLFLGCTALESVNFSDLSKASMMVGMFFDCTALKVIDMSQWNLIGAYSFGETFKNCIALESVNFGNIPRGNYFNETFRNAQSLNAVHMGAIGNVSYTSDMFRDITISGTLYYDGNYDFSKIIAALPATWTAVDINNQGGES